ncbi:unnamed protein product [Rhodiola kirilowii]
MACLEMYNSSPRISFSYDFVESHNFTNSATRPPPPSLPPPSSDFEFSVSNHGLVSADMICADELFSKGKLLPYKYSNSKARGVASSGGGGGGGTTLRDELLTGHEDNEISTSTSSSSSTAASFSKPPKSSGNRWKGFLGLRRSHIGSKKPEKTDGTVGHQPKSHGQFDLDPLYNKTSQEMVSDGCSSSRDVELGI